MNNVWLKVDRGVDVRVKAGCAEEIGCAAEALLQTLRALSFRDVRVVVGEKNGDENRISLVLSLFEEADVSPLQAERVKAYRQALLGADGFCVAREGNRFYVLSHTPSGVYYGAHDFLEKNLGVVFARGASDYALEYADSQDGWEVKRYDYAEKSPFAIRAWNMCGVGTEGRSHVDLGTAIHYGKNKLNGVFHEIEEEWTKHGLRGCGILAMPANHIDDLIETHPEYFMTDLDGKPKAATHESFVNYYNAEAAQVVAERLVSFLNGADDRHLYHWGMPDNPYFYMKEGDRELSAEPFTTDDGNVVYPTDSNYKSTVYFNFMNRVVRAVNRLRPNTDIFTFAYLYSEQAPATKIDDHLIVSLAPIYTNEKYAYTETKDTSNEVTAKNIEKWAKKSSRLCIYSYWNSFKGTIYTRPILRQVKEDLLWFEGLGVYGFTAEGKVDCSLVENMSAAQKSSRKFFDMNEACTWVINKLLWNPREDVDELLRRYATAVYKETAEEFLRYYALVEKGFNEKDAYVWYPTGGDVYILQFIIEAGIKDEVLETLAAAEKKATTPSVRSRWESIAETVRREIAKYVDFVKEEGVIYACPQGTDISSAEALDYKNNPNSVWNRAKPLRVLRNYDNMEHYPKEAGFECRMLFDGERLFVGYAITDDKISESYADESGNVRIVREDGSVVESYAETYIGGNELNQSVYYGYISGFTPKAEGQFYENEGSPTRIRGAEGLRDHRFVKTSETPKERYYFHVQEIPLSALKVTKEDFTPYGSFVYYTDRFHRAGWMGFGLWSKQNFQSYKIEK